MPQYQQTLFFEDVDRSYGWSESYFRESPDPQLARTAMDSLIGFRLDVLVDLCQISAARVSDVDITNDSLLSVGLPLPGNVASTILTAADPWSCLNLRIEASDLYRGRKFIHGILENTFSDNRAWNPANPNAAQWLAFFTELEDNYNLRINSPGPFSYISITKCVPLKETTRKVGRPFGLLVGRRTT